MTSANNVSVVCFDLGGVLVRIWRTWRESCAAAGLAIRGDAASDGAEIARRDLMDRYARGLLAEHEWIEQSVASLGGAYTAAELVAIHRAQTLDEYPGVAGVVDALHARGVATACLSNTNHAHWLRLSHRDGGALRAGPPEYPTVSRLGAHYASHLLGLAKPDAAIYRAFERASGHGGDRVLFFDDLPENVAAARALGWRAEHIDPFVDDTAPQLRGHLERHGVLPAGH